MCTEYRSMQNHRFFIFAFLTTDFDIEVQKGHTDFYFYFPYLHKGSIVIEKKSLRDFFRISCFRL